MDSPFQVQDRYGAAADKILNAPVFHSDHLELSEQFDKDSGYEGRTPVGQTDGNLASRPAGLGRDAVRRSNYDYTGHGPLQWRA